MSESTYNRESLLEILHNREATVKFRKVNHDLRTMRCTLKFDLLPEKMQKVLLEKAEDDKDAIPNEDVIVAYDLDAGGWRSFRLDRIIEVL